MISSDNMELAIKIHGELSRIVRPASPESIRASKIKNNMTLKSIIGFGAICFLLLPLSFLVAQKELVQIFAAAGLGITFQSLYTANKFLKTATYDPKHDQGYIINYALGLFAGCILGYFGKELLQNGSESVMLAAPALALIGGYSAEAVAQILQRVSETLVTMVRGSNDEKSQVYADKKINENTVELAGQLTETLQGGSDKMKKNIEKLIQDLLNKK